MGFWDFLKQPQESTPVRAERAEPTADEVQRDALIKQQNAQRLLQTVVQDFRGAAEEHASAVGMAEEQIRDLQAQMRDRDDLRRAAEEAKAQAVQRAEAAAALIA